MLQPHLTFILFLVYFTIVVKTSMNLLFRLDESEMKVLIKVYLNIVDAVQHFTFYLHKTASNSVTQSGKIKKDFCRQTSSLGMSSIP